MNLGVPPDTSKELRRGYYLHEFGHALGFFHEHQSPFLEGEVEVDSKLIYTVEFTVLTLVLELTSFYVSHFKYDKTTVENQVTRLYTELQLGNFSTFDPKSIMV